MKTDGRWVPASQALPLPIVDAGALARGNATRGNEQMPQPEAQPSSHSTPWLRLRG